MGAHRITVRFANIPATPDVSTTIFRPTVLVQKGCKDCRLEHCDVIGAGKPLLKSA